MELSQEELRVIAALRKLDDVQYTVCIAAYIESVVVSVQQVRRIEESGADNVVRLHHRCED